MEQVSKPNQKLVMKTYQSSQYERTPRAQHLGAKPSFTVKPSGEVLPATAWRKLADAFASSVADKTIRRARHNVAHLRNDLRSEAESALALWVGLRTRNGFDALSYLQNHVVYSVGRRTPSLRFWPRSLWRAAFRACDNLQHKFAKAEAQPCAFFDVFTAEESPRAINRETWTHPLHKVASMSYAKGGADVDEPNGELCAALVNIRCNLLAEKIRERMAGETSNRARGAGKQWLAYVEHVRAYGLAASSGETFTAAQALTFAHTTVADVVESLSIRTLAEDGTAGRFAAHDGKGGVTGTRKAKRELSMAARSTLWKKARAFADYVGVTFNARENGFAALLG